ncbi:hypothetical protein Xsze_02786 [Xenorhabdus szentirmaii DSM 16338]|nr:hypothetical protein Xsze_02786 [Xenorhabdus szentirmaii DSM 16338]
MNQLTRMQHKFRVTGDDFHSRATETKGRNDSSLGMILVSIGLATTILTPLLSLL